MAPRLQPREFYRQMRKLARNKAADPLDNVSSNLLRNGGWPVANALALLFNFVFSDPWKHTPTHRRCAAA